MNGSLASSLRLQSTIVHALMMQDIDQRYSESRFGKITAVLEPMGLIAMMYVLKVYLQGATQERGIPITLFLVTGFLTFYCFRTIVNGVSAAAQRKTNQMMFPQVTSFDVIAARAISTTIIISLVMMMVFVALSVFQGFYPQDCLLVIVAAGMTFSMAIALGLVFGSILRIFPSLKIAQTLLLRADLLLSGTLFLAAELPSKLLPYVVWNPTFHTIELMREAWFRGYISPIANPAYVIVVLIVVFALGLSLERITRLRVN